MKYRIECDVVVIGAGAAGLMCAVEAGKRGRAVALLEHNASIGRKIRISGGGRCNFTNLHTGPENFICSNPHFHRSALARYTPAAFIALVESHRIPYHEKKLGQLFCDRSSDDILTLFQNECAAAKVQTFLNCRVEGIRKDTRFSVHTSSGELDCESLVIATGGLSIPALGATGFGYDVARQFGLHIVETHPALVPLLLGGEEFAHLRKLHGVSFDAAVRSGKVSFRENILFTHRGLSGPAILQISSYWNRGKTIAIDTLPDEESTLPRRFLQTWNKEDDPHHWVLTPTGTEGYAKAEVTRGGVDTHELSSRTMEAVKVPGLYFIGEVVDVTGHLGGFNFQWAWASGAAAGGAA